jgi:hypothetical protein
MTIDSWQLWALLSAVFAALTAIFAKIGVENIGSDLATFIRTVVVLLSFLVLLRPASSVRPDLFRRAPGHSSCSRVSARGLLGSAISVHSSSVPRHWWHRSTN